MANIKDFVKNLKNVRKRIRKDFDKCIKDTAIQGVDNIKSELSKEDQRADVTYKIKSSEEFDSIIFSTTLKTEQIKADDLTGKEVAKFKKVLGNVPIEMLSDEINKQVFSEFPINKAMERTQQTLIKKVDKIFQNSL
jgi:hypothetical protein